MNISACVIVKNEEKHLRECLESLRFADEVILVDTGSKDKTLDIAKEFANVKIFKKSFNKYYFSDWKLKKLFHFSNARNFALDMATKDWILTIDADERVENPTHIGKLLEYDEITAWRLDQVSIIKSGGKEIETPCSSTRLWRNHLGIRYEKIVHETVDEYLEREQLRVEKCDARLIHVGFLDNKFSKQKALRVIEAIKYEKQPYMWYYLGVAYTQLEDIDNATECFIKAVQTPMAGNIKAHAYCILADIYRQSSLFYTDLSREMIGKSFELAPNQNLGHLIMAEIYKQEGNKAMAGRQYKALKNKDTSKSQMHQDILVSKKDINSKIHELITSK